MLKILLDLWFQSHTYLSCSHIICTSSQLQLSLTSSFGAALCVRSNAQGPGWSCLLISPDGCLPANLLVVGGNLLSFSLFGSHLCMFPYVDWFNYAKKLDDIKDIHVILK